MLSSREIAGLIWLGLLLIAALGNASTRKSINSLLQSFFQSKILAIFLMYFTWISGGVYLAYLAGAWQLYMLSPTILWIFLVGIPLIFGMTKAAKDPQWILNQLRTLISATIFLEFIINVRTFHLVVEFALQGFLGFFFLLATVASIRPEHRITAKTMNYLLGIIGLILLGAGIMHLISAREHTNWCQTTLNFLMPLWLGAWAALFVAALGLFSNLEQIFRLMSRENPSWFSRFWRILPLALRAGLRPSEIGDFRFYWCGKLANASGNAEARQVVGEFLQYLADIKTQEAAAAKKLIENTDFKGVDEKGAQLDQREFKETWNALESIMTWFHGWHGKNTEGYDLAKIHQIMTFKNFNDLPKDYEIIARVSPNGESCYAMRKTVSGRILAVGMHGHDYRLWYWDGDKEPIGFPGKGGDWGTDWFALPPNPNR